MGYEEYLQALTRMEGPGVWWPVISVAMQMNRPRRLVSAYMTRLHKMGLVKRRRYYGAGRGRPGYAYRLSRRGREHVRWLEREPVWERQLRMHKLLMADAKQIQWTQELDDEIVRFLRRLPSESVRGFWKTMLGIKRSQVLNDPMSIFDLDPR